MAEQADSAAKKGDFAKAERLYREHLVVVPDDVEIQIKYADVLLKGTPSPKRQAEALQIYAGILRRNPGRDDVRRKQMELKIAMGHLHVTRCRSRLEDPPEQWRRTRTTATSCF